MYNSDVQLRPNFIFLVPSGGISGKFGQVMVTNYYVAAPNYLRRDHTSLIFAAESYHKIIPCVNAKVANLSGYLIKSIDCRK